MSDAHLLPFSDLGVQVIERIREPLHKFEGAPLWGGPARWCEGPYVYLVKARSSVYDCSRASSQGLPQIPLCELSFDLRLYDVQLQLASWCARELKLDERVCVPVEFGAGMALRSFNGRVFPWDRLAGRAYGPVSSEQERLPNIPSKGFASPESFLRELVIAVANVGGAP